MTLEMKPGLTEGHVVTAPSASSPPEFPHYKEQEPDVTARFQRIYQRPVVMDVRGRARRFRPPAARSRCCAT